MHVICIKREEMNDNDLDDLSSVYFRTNCVRYQRISKINMEILNDVGKPRMVEVLLVDIQTQYTYVLCYTK